MRHQSMRRRRGRWPDLERLVEEAEEDQPQQRRDCELEPAVAVALQPEDPEGDEPGDHPGRQQRYVEEHGQSGPTPAPRKKQLEGACALYGCRCIERRAHASSDTRIARASVAPSTCTSPRARA